MDNSRLRSASPESHCVGGCCPCTSIYSIYRYLGPKWGSDRAGGICQPLGLMVGGRSDAACTWCHLVPRVFSLYPVSAHPPWIVVDSEWPVVGGREQSPFGGQS